MQQAYIDVYGKRRRVLIPIREIVLTRLEGDVALVDKPETFPTWFDANWRLARSARFAPAGGAYDKHRFVLTWEDGATYTGRFDLHHQDYYGLIGPRLQDHVQRFAEWCLSDKARGMLTGEIIETYREIQARYDIGQVPPIIPDDEPAEIVRDCRQEMENRRRARSNS